MTPWLWVPIAYLLGAIPSSYLAGKWTRGIDLRQHGSGNLGATNTFRVLGAKIAVPVLIFDVLKGLVPTAVFPRWDGDPAWSWALAYGAAAIAGHVFPVYMGFRGGKGVATAGGVFLALAPVAVGVATLVWTVLLRLFRMVSLASIGSALALIAVLAVTERRPPVLWLGVAVGAFIIYSHRANIRRMLRGEEYRFERRKAEAPPVTGRERR